MANTSITRVNGVRVGHAVSERNITGTTVVLLERPSPTVVDVRGGWPGTFDTDSLGSGRTFHSKHAIFLTGGDVFGLRSAAGIQRFLLERGNADDHQPSALPGVVGANIYDLEFGKRLDKVDYEQLGYRACWNASARSVQQGNVGAGLGATVGKLRGIGHAMKGGVGSSAKGIGGLTVGALVVANAVGNVFNDKGVTIAGTRRELSGREFVELDDMAKEIVSGRAERRSSMRATTIGVVATDLQLSHEELLRVATMAHDGIARCVRPAHGATDGDTLFCVSTAQRKSARLGPDVVTLIGQLAADQVQTAIVNGVLKAKTLAGVPSVS